MRNTRFSTAHVSGHNDNVMIMQLRSSHCHCCHVAVASTRVYGQGGVRARASAASGHDNDMTITTVRLSCCHCCHIAVATARACKGRVRAKGQCGPVLTMTT